MWQRLLDILFSREIIEDQRLVHVTRRKIDGSVTVAIEQWFYRSVKYFLFGRCIHHDDQPIRRVHSPEVRVA